ncbi:lipoprotein [Streptomyces indicus]|uniref:Lipoprotein n=1 Tax=Streptomyces indicus TaxID=417292 RepID=A0A1G9GXH4_9ACTN|nr:lipoprotein [Streptomyces indicus]SDL05388.1 hypothetical protein SAMN05421806_11776 [Streptomyces indicus]
MRSSVVRAVLAAALVGGLVAGCSSESSSGEGAESSSGEGAKSPSASAKPTSAAPTEGAGGAKGEAAEQAGTVGDASSPCKLPVTFGTAAKWQPEAIDIARDDEFADLAVQGPVIARCEIDAKPAGSIGFLRVYVEDPAGKDSEPLDILRAYVAADEEPADAMYRAFTSGGVKGHQVEYETTSKLLEETRTVRAFAVPTPDGVVVVSLGGLDAEEHASMIPAYELAKQSVRVND